MALTRTELKFADRRGVQSFPQRTLTPHRYYKAVVRILPKAEPVLRRLESNFEMWKKLKEGTARGSFNGGRASKAKGEAPLAVTDT